MSVYLSYAKNMVSEGRDKQTEWVWLNQAKTSKQIVRSPRNLYGCKHQEIGMYLLIPSWSALCRLERIDFPAGSVFWDFLLHMSCKVADALSPLHCRMRVNWTKIARIIVYNSCTALTLLNYFKAGPAQILATILTHKLALGPWLICNTFHNSFPLIHQI